MDPKRCDRCNSVIVAGRFEEPYGLPPKPSDGENAYELGEARLCATCVEELYQWVEGESVDRSNTVDPVSLDRLERTATRYINDLQEILDALDR